MQQVQRLGQLTSCAAFLPVFVACAASVPLQCPMRNHWQLSHPGTLQAQHWTGWAGQQAVCFLLQQADRGAPRLQGLLQAAPAPRAGWGRPALKVLLMWTPLVEALLQLMADQAFDGCSVGREPLQGLLSWSLGQVAW